MVPIPVPKIVEPELVVRIPVSKIRNLFGWFLILGADIPKTAHPYLE